MGSYESSIEVDVPVSTAYNQWTQFKEFPQFMKGVERIDQLDDKRLHWVAEVAGQRREWDAEIVEQQPDERIAWRSTSGTTNAGVVTFHRLDENRSKVMLQMEVEPEGAIETAGDLVGVIKGRINGDLKRFKEYIESRGSETGAWRGEIDHGRVEANK